MAARRMSQDSGKDILTALFASSARGAILRFFLLDPFRAYYQRQIEAATSLAIRSVQRELERLTRVGLLHRRVEGNRTYYQVDMQFPLFLELREIVLKTAGRAERLRGKMAMDDAVRLAFLNEADNRVLLIVSGKSRPVLSGLFEYEAEIMTCEEFLRGLLEGSEVLERYLVQGADLLGRRDDVIWRRIEAAGYLVEKREGVA